MAKKNSKGWRNRRQSKIPNNMVEEKKNEISVPNISISIPQPDPSTNQLSYLVSTYGQMVQSETEEDKDVSDSFSGFIFMCNTITKPECFRYRVFGLPVGKRDVVEKIKTGMKLFLYDFDLKLLYGVYEASCNGQLNLEPYAFGGKYPAQVKFSIHKECLPLPEQVLKCAIDSNYHGGKFNQELSGLHVRNLTLSFRPLDVVPPLPPISIDRQIGSPPLTDNSYASLATNHYAPFIQRREVIQHKDLSDHHGTMLNHVPYSMGHQSLPLPPGNPYYELNTGQTYLHGNVPQQMLYDQSLRVIERAQYTRLETHYPTVSAQNTRPETHYPTMSAQNMRLDTHYPTVSPQNTRFETHYPTVSAQNTRLERHSPTVSYYQERGSYLQQPVSQGLQYSQGQSQREAPGDITFYQNKYSEAAYGQVLQANASSNYGIPGQVSQTNASSHYEIPAQVSQANASSSHYEIPAQVSWSSHYGIPAQVSQANASSHYGIPGYEQVSYHFQHGP